MYMIKVINKKPKKDELRKIMSDMDKKGKTLDASKYSGKLKLKADPLIVQKKLRDEWN